MKQDFKKMRKWLFVAVILLIAVIAVVMMSMKKQEAPEVPQTEPTEVIVETTEAATEPVKVDSEPVLREYEVVELVDGQIQTPYGILNFPDSLSDHLLVINTSKEPYILEFYAAMEGKQELRMFDIALGEGSGGNMGMAATAEGEIPFNVTIYDLIFEENWSEGEIYTACAMQDVVNDIIDQLAAETKNAESGEPAISQQPNEDYAINNLEIETPYATLYYPARWANTLSYSHDDSQESIYKVHFYTRMQGRDPVHLFSIYFGGDEGEQIGAVMGEQGIPVTVNWLMGNLNLEGWTQEEADTAYAMQEALNDVIARLPLLP